MEHDGLTWTGRGDGHQLHVVATTEPSGRATFGCGREGWPEVPAASPPPGRCSECAAWVTRHHVEPIPDPRQLAAARWGSRRPDATLAR